jgi:hypothetical protein
MIQATGRRCWLLAKPIVLCTKRGAPLGRELNTESAIALVPPSSNRSIAADSPAAKATQETLPRRSNSRDRLPQSNVCYTYTSQIQRSATDLTAPPKISSTARRTPEPSPWVAE